MSIPLLINEALRTRREFNISLSRQLWQAVQLRFGPGKLDPWEYFFFQVFLDRYPPDEKRRFIGWRGEIQLDRRANAHNAREPANNKLACHTLLSKHNMPQAKITAVYCNNNPEVPDSTILNNPDAVATFLRDPDHYPLFVKPVRGARGKQTYALQGFSNGGLQLTSGRHIGIADFIASFDPAKKGGVLFQELLKTSPDIATVCGSRLTSVRVVVIMTATGAEILSAVWRIPTGANITDNFDCGRSGNIIAGVELTNGSIQRVVRGIGWETVPISHHPDTHGTFENFQLPGWHAIRTLCLEAAALLPNLRLQHWDIALTDRGPVILEVNVEGGLRTHQIVQRRGLYGARLQRLSVA